MVNRGRGLATCGTDCYGATMNTRLLRDDQVIEEWMLASGEQGNEVLVPTTIGEWSAVSELRADVHLSPGARGEIRCDIDLPSRAAGFDTDDGFWCNMLVSPRAGNSWEGWRELRLPAECFYVRGIPAGWGRPRSVRITAPAGSRIRSVRLLARSITEGPRVTDEAFLDAVDLEAPGMAAARAAKGRGATAEAMEEVARAMGRRGLDRRSVILNRPAADEATGTGEADAILAGRIMGQEWPDGIDWNANPVGYIEWSVRIHVLDFLSPLAHAWRRTRDERYLRGMERIVVDWMGHNPVPVGVRGCGLAWGHSLVPANRAFGPLLDCLDALVASGTARPRVIAVLVKSLWEHAEYLLAFESYPPSNKTIAEGRTILALGCALPELGAAARWRERALARLLQDMEIQVLPDGASYELTPGYQLAIADWFLEAHQVAAKFGVPLDPRYERGVRAMYTWSTLIARPDGTRPSISDAGSADTAYGPRLTVPGRILGDAAAAWVGSAGAEGTKPTVRSVALADSGYFVMRSGWERDDVCLVFEAGPFGRFHQHEDMLGFDLYAWGTPFLVDPGISSYQPDPWTTFYHGTAAHNTVLVDGCPQAREARQPAEQWVKSARDRTVWRSDERCDVAMGTYDAGYAGREETVTHRRAVLFAKPDYFLVLDEIAGTGVHTCETLFHFMPFRVAVDPATKAVRTVRQNAANLEIRPLAATPVRLVCGDTDPVQGWVSLGGQDVPAPVAIYSQRDALPIRAGYLVVPFGAGRVTAGLDARTECRGDRWTIEVDLAGRRRDRITVDWSSGHGPELERA
jgi:hypothetical protein